MFIRDYHNAWGSLAVYIYIFVNKADIQMSKPRWLKGWLCSHAPPTDSRFQIHQNAPF